MAGQTSLLHFVYSVYVRVCEGSSIFNLLLNDHFISVSTDLSLPSGSVVD